MKPMNTSIDALKNKVKTRKIGPLTIVACMLYLLSPIDFIPDFVPFGTIDDFALICYLVYSLLSSAQPTDP